MLCLDSKYRKSKSCGELDADGYAHHAYTTSAGPRFKPSNKDDVTIGVLSRLTTAIDKAADAGALPKHLPVYLTEFGIQSTPDKVSGVSLAKQAAYMAISEHIAYVNPRVAAFSQYLLSDDPPRVGGLQVRRVRERPALRGRQDEAGLRGLPAAARGRGLRHQRRALGPRAPAARREQGDDRAQAEGRRRGAR